MSNPPFHEPFQSYRIFRPTPTSCRGAACASAIAARNPVHWQAWTNYRHVARNCSTGELRRWNPPVNYPPLAQGVCPFEMTSATRSSPVNARACTMVLQIPGWAHPAMTAGPRSVRHPSAAPGGLSHRLPAAGPLKFRNAIYLAQTRPARPRRSSPRAADPKMPILATPNRSRSSGSTSSSFATNSLFFSRRTLTATGTLLLIVPGVRR